MLDYKKITQEVRGYTKVYKKIAEVLVEEKVNIQTAMIVLSAMSEALFKYMVNHPEAFDDGTPLDEILGLKGEDLK